MADTSQPRFTASPPEVAGIEELEMIGRGGFGTVYRGYQAAFHRTVAVKVLDSVAGGGEAGRRFRQEVAAMGSVSQHPYVVPVYAAGTTADGRPFLVMPFVPGGSLADRIVRGSLPWPDVVSLGVRVARALGAAHAVGVLHRDVKPANILYSGYGEPQLADFGVARVAGATRTITGLVTATVTYAPPEILSGETARPTSDVYSLAATLHAALVGGPPFAGVPGEPLAATVARIVTEPTPDLRPAGVPEALAAVIERAMQKDPDRRTATAEQFAAELTSAATTPTPIRQPAPPVTVPTPLVDRADPPFDAPDPPAVVPAPLPAEDSAPSRAARPPGTPVPWPPPLAPDPADEEWSHRTKVLAGSVLLALLVAFAAFFVGRTLIGENDRPEAGARSSTTSAPTSSPSTDAEPPPTDAPVTSSPPSSTAATPSSPSTTSSTSTSTSTTSSGVPATGTGPGPGASTVEDTVTRYYALVGAQSLPEAFSWLSPGYQDVTGGFDRYAGFWRTIRSVSVGDVEPSGSDRARATLTYITTDGRRSVEQAELGFVRDERTNNFLIDSYEVD